MFSKCEQVVAIRKAMANLDVLHATTRTVFRQPRKKTPTIELAAWLVTKRTDVQSNLRNEFGKASPALRVICRFVRQAMFLM